MAKSAALSAVLLILLTASCSSKTEALAGKSLMSRPLLHSPPSSQPAAGRPSPRPASAHPD